MTKEEVKTSDALGDGPPARTQVVLSPRNQRQPTVRLVSVSVMTKADQQPLELLLDQLVERRLSQLLKREGT